ncbi:MAG: Flagellar hook-associated protein 2 [Acidobacteria bacterium ADurb.Bin340]|nr:MAG: Flagellar hook-associated protein 2 [Acidobacteria bacterium ADurb.Bin340]
MASPISFQGLSTNLPTDQLVEAILQAEGQGMVRMQDRQNLNAKRASLIRTFRTNLMALQTTFGTLANSSFSSRSVTSSDANNTYLAATANGAANGTYEVVVRQAAQGARLTAPAATTSLTASLGGTDSVGDGTGTYDYTLTNTDGEAVTVSLSAANNTLGGLRDAINAQAGTTGVQATVVQTAATGDSYKLVLSTTGTGQGTAGDSVYLKGNAGNLLGLADTGSGTQSQVAAKNALFSVNGIELERSSNVVTDAVDGLTLTLKAGDETKTTTLTVGTNREGLKSAMGDLVAKYNALYKAYKDNSGSGGALAGDSTLRTILSQVRSFMTGQPQGIAADATYRSGAELGLKTERDGTLGFDSTAFLAAVDKDPGAVEAVFNKAYSAFQTYAAQVTSPGSGNLASILQSIETQNARLSTQIASTQTRLDRRREALQMQFSRLESLVGQMQAAGQSLGSL